ncbi:uncharacterized protein BCR38DRAFT_312720 [Pseudomassariella vexata]
MAIETVTIINNSGKIITNGKHIFGLFKEAKASYDEKKAAVKAERAVRRSNTFDVANTPQYYDEVEYVTGHGRRASFDDTTSHASSRRSHRSRHSRTTTAKNGPQAKSRPPLTVSNLRTMSEFSSSAPSRALRRTLTRVPSVRQYDERIATEMAVQRPPNMYAQCATSDPSLPKKKEKEIDMNLAYGEIPPDLESRVDLDPAYKAAEKERSAHTLMEQIEALLTEAHCIHHTANHMITHLQSNPEAAAAVALALAELSTLLGKMSPAFLGSVKAGSPAVFALLASPQFLIAAGVMTGVTVVMFGGWKIIKRIKEVQDMREARIALPAASIPMAIEEAQQRNYVQSEYRSEYRSDFDEALVLEEEEDEFEFEEELSSIETWRRGIAPFGEDESADMELISPEADRAIRSQYGGDDARTERSVRTHRSSKTAKSSKTVKPHKSSSNEAGSQRSYSTSRTATTHSVTPSESGTVRTSKTGMTSRSKRTLAIEDGSRDREKAAEFAEVVTRVKPPVKPKKDSMLKKLFQKKKEREEVLQVA